MNESRTILLVGGSDSSGGAGLQADCAVARINGIMPVCAVSCITSQGVSGLKMIQSADAEIFESQLVTAFEELNPSGVKIGMIADENLIKILIEKLDYYHPANVVLDPVMAPSAGNFDLCSQMWHNGNLLKAIAPMINLITPNIPEAQSMLGVHHRDISNNEMIELCQSIKKEYNFNGVLLKGGHSISDNKVDLLFSDDDPAGKFFSHDSIDTRNSHGTGCALSSAIVCNLIAGKNMSEACETGITFLQDSLVRNRSNIFYNNSLAKGPAFF